MATIVLTSTEPPPALDSRARPTISPLAASMARPRALVPPISKPAITPTRLLARPLTCLAHVESTRTERELEHGWPKRQTDP